MFHISYQNCCGQVEQCHSSTNLAVETVTTRDRKSYDRKSREQSRLAPTKELTSLALLADERKSMRCASPLLALPRFQPPEGSNLLRYSRTRYNYELQPQAPDWP